jgi:hypothetical protein
MQHLRVIPVFLSICALSLALSGCGSSQMGSSMACNGNSSQTNTPPTVSGVAAQPDGAAPSATQEVQCVDTQGNTTVQLSGASANTDYFVQFCPAVAPGCA